MPFTLVSLGTQPSGVGGDTIRSANVKINGNFTLLQELGFGGNAAVIENAGSWKGNRFKGWGNSAPDGPSSIVSVGLDMGYQSNRRAQIAINMIGELYARGVQADPTDATGWRRYYSDRNIVGTVSQSGGVPTGAVIERGSNANGEYVKYADGTMICWFSINVTDQAIDTPYTSGIYQGTRAWSFPVTFSGVPIVSPGVFRWGSAANWAALAGSPSGSTATLRGFDTVARAAGTAAQISAIAIGRWF